MVDESVGGVTVTVLGGGASDGGGAAAVSVCVTV
jgi:hypothetical protein